MLRLLHHRPLKIGQLRRCTQQAPDNSIEEKDIEYWKEKRRLRESRAQEGKMKWKQKCKERELQARRRHQSNFLAKSEEDKLLYANERRIEKENSIHRLRQAEESGVKVCIDLSLDSNHNEKERNSLFKHVTLLAQFMIQ